MTGRAVWAWDKAAGPDVVKPVCARCRPGRRAGGRRQPRSPRPAAHGLVAPLGVRNSSGARPSMRPGAGTAFVGARMERDDAPGMVDLDHRVGHRGEGRAQPVALGDQRAVLVFRSRSCLADGAAGCRSHPSGCPASHVRLRSGGGARRNVGDTARAARRPGREPTVSSGRHSRRCHAERASSAASARKSGTATTASRTWCQRRPVRHQGRPGIFGGGGVPSASHR